MTEAERQEAQRVGQYMKIASPTAEEMVKINQFLPIISIRNVLGQVWEKLMF